MVTDISTTWAEVKSQAYYYKWRPDRLSWSLIASLGVSSRENIEVDSVSRLGRTPFVH